MKWETYSFNENNESRYMVIDKKKNLKMSSDNLTLSKLSKQVFEDSRLDEVEKCVVLYQMFTYVGNDMYEENIKNIHIIFKTVILNTNHSIMWKILFMSIIFVFCIKK